MNKKTGTIVLGAALYLALGLVLVLSARASSLHALLRTLTIASIVVGVTALAAAILALLIWGAKEGGGGIRGAALIVVLLGVPVYFALQESPSEYPLGHLIAVIVLALLQVGAFIVAALFLAKEQPLGYRIWTILILLPACILATLFAVVLVRASWTLLHRGYPLITQILVGLINPLWTIAFLVAPPVVAVLLMETE